MDPFDLIHQGKISRFFRSTRKLNTPNLVSHITQRAAGKEPLFVEDGDYLFMLALLKEIAEKYSLNVFAFCLMPNHVHLLLSPKETNLYDAMRDLFSRYAVGFNRKYERKGHLFGGPYRQSVCLDDRYLLAASLYIHLNPVNAGIKNDPRHYRWSSVRLFCEHDAPESFVAPDIILGLLSNNKRESKAEYQRMLFEGSDIETEHVLEQEDALERFCSKLVSLFPRFFERIDVKKHIASASGIDLPSMDALEIQIESIKTSRFPPKNPESKAARRYIIQQLVARGFKRREIAEKLGVSRKTVYNTLKTNV